jgi:hypothetical protein
VFRPSTAPLVVRLCAGQDGAARSGKHKSGGPLLPPDAVLARVLSGAEEYVIRTCVPSALLEVNSRLVATPEVLREGPTDHGFVAILKPQPAALAELRTLSLDATAYVAARRSG